MGDNTGIEWTTATWNPLAGCSLVSPGCTNCYAMKQAARIERMNAGTDRSPHYRGTTKSVNGIDVWTGKVNLAADISQPLRWKKPRLIFVNSMSDLFHENVGDGWIARIFAVMAACPQHTFQILTKRADRMRSVMSDPEFKKMVAEKVFNAQLATVHAYKPPLPVWPLPNVWLGVSVEDQKRANERIPELLATPATVRFLSCEPLLGPVDLTRIFDSSNEHSIDALSGRRFYDPRDSDGEEEAKIDWVIVGGESGSGARPMHPDWAREIRDQCVAADVAFFFKQWGQWIGGQVYSVEKDGITHGGRATCADGREHGGKRTHWWSGDTFGGVISVEVGKHAAGSTLDGREWKEMPTKAVAA